MTMLGAIPGNHVDSAIIATNREVDVIDTIALLNLIEECRVMLGVFCRFVKVVIDLLKKAQIGFHDVALRWRGEDNSLVAATNPPEAKAQVTPNTSDLVFVDK